MSAPLLDLATASPAEPDSPWEFLDVLDQMRIGAGPDAWTVHVMGAHCDGSDLWIQIAPRPDGADSFVLRLSKHATLRHALAALTSLPAAPPHLPPVVPVMCRVG